MAKLHPEIEAWFQMAQPGDDPIADPLGAAQRLKRTMIEKWVNHGDLEKAWGEIASKLPPGGALSRFFIDLPEKPSADPYGHAFGRKAPFGADSAPVDVSALRAKFRRYREAAEDIKKLLDDHFDGMLASAQNSNEAREHVIPLSVSLDAMRSGLPHLIGLLDKINPTDTIPSKQPGAADVARKNYRAQVARACLRHFDRTPYAAVSVLTNAIAGIREDGEEWVDAESLRRLIERSTDKRP